MNSTVRSSALGRLLQVTQTRVDTDTRTVLHDISCTVRQGEIVGVIGKNGSGKSTLVKLIAGILQPDQGSISTAGRIVPLIHLDSGVKDRLTMRENIFLAGTLLGMSAKEITEIFDDVVAMSGLGEFVHTKWYQFSDGMKQKVVFALGVYARPDILLLDEAFSAGDEAFRQKSLKTLQELAQKGTAIMMVGHTLSSMETVCDRILWIDDTTIVAEGDPQTVIGKYLATS